MVLKWIKRLLILLVSFVLLLIVTVLLSVPFSKMDSYQLPLTITSEKIAITNVNLVPITGSELQGLVTVLLDNGAIKAIQPLSESIDVGYVQKNARGAYLLPGLMDLHTHIFDKSDLTLNLSYGVTSVRNMMGFPMHLRWKAELKAGKLLGPDLFSSSPTLNSGDNGGPFHKKVESNEEIRTLVKRYKQAGFDLIKFYDGLSPQQFETLVSEARKQNIPIAGHPPRAISIRQLLDSKPASIEHVEELYQGYLDYEKDEELAEKLAKEIAASGVYIIPSLSAYHHIYKADTNADEFFSQQRRQFINPLVQFIGDRQLSWINEADYSKNIKSKDEFLGLLVTKLAEAGANMALGTDTGPSMTIHGKTVFEEMMLYKKYGLNNSLILKMATLNGAEVLGVTSNKGSITVNKDADMILLDKNPLQHLETLENPIAVIKNGQWFGQEELKILRNRGKDHYSFYHTMGLFLEHLLTK